MNLNNTKSAALLTVLILIVILMILSSAMLSLLSNQTRLIDHGVSRAKAKYASEATLVREIEYLRKNQTSDTQYCVTGRYEGQYSGLLGEWQVGVNKGAVGSVIPGVSELNMTADYGTVF